MSHGGRKKSGYLPAMDWGETLYSHTKGTVFRTMGQIVVGIYLEVEESIDRLPTDLLISNWRVQLLFFHV